MSAGFAHRPTRFSAIPGCAERHGATHKSWTPYAADWLGYELPLDDLVVVAQREPRHAENIALHRALLHAGDNNQLATLVARAKEVVDGSRAIAGVGSGGPREAILRAALAQLRVGHQPRRPPPPGGAGS